MFTAEDHITARAETESQESVLDLLLMRIQRSDEFPSISKYLIEINQKLAADQETADASELANIILKDYALTNKLLKLVNSAFYGFAAGKVTTVTRAVVLLGSENVRLATLSLALFEHFKSKSNTFDLKETVITAFWAGMLAREIAKMDTAVDPEEAFVCAMMGQLGKMLMIFYLPDEYQRIVKWVMEHQESEAKAVRTVCGVAYDELGEAVARQWNFPDPICESIPRLTKADWRDKRKPPGRLRALSSFARTLGATIQKGDAQNVQKTIAALLEEYQSRVNVSERQLKTLIQDSLDKVQLHAGAMNFDISKSPFLHRLGNFYTPGKSDSPMPGQHLIKESASFRLTGDADLKSNATPAEGLSAKDIIMEGIQEISEAMMADTDVNDVALMSLEILYRAHNFNRALLFVREGQSAMMRARFGYGEHIQRLTGKTGFKVGGGKDLFNLSLQVGKDLIVADAYDKKMSHLVPAWYRQQMDAPAFIFLPVMVQTVCIGAFYADCNQSGQPISETEHRHLSMLRNQLVLAIKYRQSNK